MENDVRRATPPIAVILLFGWLLVACQDNEGAVPTPVAAATVPVDGNDEAPGAEATIVAPTTTAPTATPSPTATPLPPKELTVCLAQEPATLYLYGDNSLAATAVRHAVYEDLYTSLGYAYQPRGLVALPTLDNGGIQVREVSVTAGDRVVDADGAVVLLAAGTELRTAAGDLIVYEEETAVTLPQLSVDYTLQPLVWSDGTPVTAADSVYSFGVAADPATSNGRARVNRTVSYEATGERGLRWVGLPGFVDANVLDYVWPPLPQHQLDDFAAPALAALPEAARQPLSSGPFVVEEWLDGEAIHLAPNPHYYRQDDELPYLDRLTFRFLPEDFDRENPLATGLWRDGVCDVMTQDAFFVESLPALDAALAADGLVVQSLPGPVFEQIAFGVNSYGVYGDGRERPDWFDDARVRQGMALCLDRESLVQTLLGGRSAVIHSYVPDNHPLYPGELPAWEYDPAAGRRLIAQAGYVDSDGDGVREDPLTERPFRISLLTDNGNSLRQPVTEQFRQDMAACGIEVDLLYVAPPELYADGPAGTVFGRSFDLAQFAWLSAVEPPCHLWLGRNVTGPREEGFGGWGNVNPTGWQNDAFDAACQAGITALADEATYAENHQEAMAIFAEELPIIPLFAYPKVAVARDEVSGFALDSSQLSELWNVAEWDVERP